MENPHIDSVDPQGNPDSLAAESPRDSDLVPQVTQCKPDQTPLWKMVLETFAVIVGIVVAGIYYGQLYVMRGQLGEIIKQYPELKKSADAAKEASDTAHDTMVLSERPWVKIKHRIVKPLTFDVMRWKGPVAMMVVEDTVENVGPSTALNVFSWEDVIPLDDHGIETAKARQTEWCEANRHRKAGGLSGYMLFPRDPFVQNSTVGPFMEAVNKAANASPGDLHGKTAFVLVGCVVYRSSFEPPTAPAHETKFIYWLGKPLPNGGIQPYVIPHGVANKLQLIEFPDGFSAD
jgi:hypothetical protein